MSFGFSAVNANGIVQIDQDYSNYAVVAAGSTPASSDNVPSFGTISYTQTTDTVPLVFVRNRAYSTAIFTQWISRNLDTYSVGGGQDTRSKILWEGAGQPASRWGGLDYVVAQPLADKGPSSGYGLLVWDEASRLVFDSGNQYLKIVASYVLQARGVSTQTFNLPAPSPGKKLYFCLSAFGLTNASVGGGEEEHFGQAARFISDTTIQVQSEYLQSYLYPGSFNQSHWALSVGSIYFLIIAEF